MSILIENIDVYGFEAAIRGMRNPKDSWDKIDSKYADDGFHHDVYILGDNDLKLATTLHKAGPVHSKFKRMIHVSMDITAPLYWWKEFDTYKVGTVANSCSTMHKITAYEFTLDMFSHDKLYDSSVVMLKNLIIFLNGLRERYLDITEKLKEDDFENEINKKDAIDLQKIIWWQIIQLLPSSFNQKRTVDLNYEVLSNMYIHRHGHKLDEWKSFCETIKELPYFNDIIF